MQQKIDCCVNYTNRIHIRPNYTEKNKNIEPSDCTVHITKGGEITKNINFCDTDSSVPH